MLIVIDYDGTYTADTALWDRFIHTARLAGHKILCCTMRHEAIEGDDVKAALTGKVDQIIFTGRIAKANHLLSLGIKPDIWIDDKPFWIYKDSL